MTWRRTAALGMLASALMIATPSFEESAAGGLRTLDRTIVAAAAQTRNTILQRIDDLDQASRAYPGRAVLPFSYFSDLLK